ncbi:hypothetical protein GCM10027612_47620 [Microbispora bryophytorum subsp. camponoti]
MTTKTADAVSLTSATKRFGPVRAVDGLTLAIPRGQTVALLGPNGAGKSTTIALLLGLLPPDSGQAALFGLDPEQAVRQGLAGAMPQEGGLIPRVTVRELLTFVSGTYAAPLPSTGCSRSPGSKTCATAGWTGCPAGRRSACGSRWRCAATPT